MPANNRFRHQSYPTEPAVDPVVRPLSHELEEPADFSRLHVHLGVQRVLLVHGTFMGSDPIGVNAMMNGLVERRASPAMQLALKPLVRKLAEQTKRVTDVVTGEVGNYKEAYRAHFQELCGGDPIVRRLEPTWSSSNTHLARAELAVMLVNWLADLEADGLEPGRDRVLMWGHSHAGSAFALLSNLLANERESVSKFFEAAGDSLEEEGERARAFLEAGPTPHPWADSLFVVTFGAPVRYGWDTNGYRQLLHIIHHRSFDKERPERTVPAITIGCENNTAAQVQRAIFDVLAARHGDWVQTFAIAGTDLPAAGSGAANLRLHKFLEASLDEITPEKIRDRFPVNCPRWKTATRMHADGRNLLIEFDKTGLTRFGRAHQAFLGHGIYTLTPWLPAQLALVIEWLERDSK